MRVTYFSEGSNRTAFRTIGRRSMEHGLDKVYVVRRSQISVLHLPPMGIEFGLPPEFQLMNFFKLYHIVKVSHIYESFKPISRWKSTYLSEN